MSTLATKTLYTPEDLLQMEDGDRFELVDGELVEHNMSFWSNYVAGKIYKRLDDFCIANNLGWVLPEGTTYQCFPNAPNKVRKADTSFIRLDRISAEQAKQEGHVTIAPDLAVEVVSPNDLAYDVDEKVKEYLDAGVHLVWVINPQSRTLAIHRPDSPGNILREQDELLGEDVLPGFHCRVGVLFQMPAAAKT